MLVMARSLLWYLGLFWTPGIACTAANPLNLYSKIPMSHTDAILELDGMSWGVLVSLSTSFSMYLVRNAMEMPRRCHAIAMALPLGIARTSPWHCRCSAMGVPWQCHGSAMAVPWQCHGVAMAVSWQCHGNAMAVSEQCQAVP